ncbi:hypothetical protein ACOSP7_031909 [Xanthoceras sorbifolium]
MGYRQIAYPKFGRPGLLADGIEMENDEFSYDPYEESKEYIEEAEISEKIIEEHITGDLGSLMVLQCSCLTPKMVEDF